MTALFPALKSMIRPIRLEQSESDDRLRPIPLIQGFVKRIQGPGYRPPDYMILI